MAIGTFRCMREPNRARDTIRRVDRAVEDRVKELVRLFLVYDSIEQRSAAGLLDQTEMGAVGQILRDLSRRSWEHLFGPVLATPAHRRFALEWCRRNAELLMKEQVLPVIAHQVVAGHIADQLASLGEGEPAHDFAQHGPPGQAGTALRRIYLIQRLVIQFEELGGSRQIPARLQAQLRRHLIRHVKTLFAQTFPDVGGGPQPIEAYVRQGILTVEAGDRLAAALGVKLAPVAPGATATLNEPAAATPLCEMAAAAELMRRLRRAPALSQKERDRLIRMVEAELDGLMEHVSAGALQRAMISVAERVGIPVPPASATSQPDRPSAAPAARPENAASRLLPGPRANADTSDFQWAFDLIDELRRDGVDEVSKK